MNLFENTTEDDFKTGPHFIPKHNGLSEEEQKKIGRNFVKITLLEKIAESEKIK